MWGSTNRFDLVKSVGAFSHAIVNTNIVQDLYKVRYSINVSLPQNSLQLLNQR